MAAFVKRLAAMPLEVKSMKKHGKHLAASLYFSAAMGCQSEAAGGAEQAVASSSAGAAQPATSAAGTRAETIEPSAAGAGAARPTASAAAPTSAGAVASAGAAANAGAAASPVAGMAMAAGASAPAAGSGATTGAATLSQVYEMVYTKSCAVCHSMAPSDNSNGLLGMIRSKEQFYDALVNKPAQGAMCSGKGTYIVPSDPQASLVVQKLAATPSCGATMPLGGMLDATQTELLSSWIKAGALKD